MSGLFTPFPEFPFELDTKEGMTPSNPFGPWSDVAIAKIDEDRFERSEYASKVAGLIHGTADPRESTIYGLTGEWGSGKTSLVNLIRKDLSRSSTSWEIVDYNPWVASDPESLIEEFYRSIMEALPANAVGAKIKDILQKTFRSIGPIAGTLKSLGSLDALVASKIIDSVGGLKEIQEIWKPEQDSWPTLYAKASKEFKRLDKQILLIVDDIDRLHTDELALLMKVVRLLGRFPRVNYLLVYDEESLLATLVESTAVGGNKDDALRFMEKIVQYPIDVPPLTSDQIEEQLVTIFDALPSEARKLDEQRDLKVIQREMFSVWEKLLTTPRSLRRYAALLVNWLKIYDPGAVNTGDLMILATMRVAFPSAYAKISPYKESLLTNSPSLQRSSTPGSEDTEFKWKKTLGEGLDAGQLDLLEPMLFLLFPKLKNSMIIPDRKARPRAISTEVYFDTYVLFQAPKHVISDKDLDDILNDFHGSGATKLTELLNADEASQTSSVVAKMPEAIKRLEDDDQKLRAAEVLITAAEDIEDKRRWVRMGNLYDEFYLQASTALSKLSKPKEVNLYDRFFRETPLNFAVYYLHKIKAYSRKDDENWGQTQSCEEIYIRCAERICEVLDEKNIDDRDLGPYSLSVLIEWPEFEAFHTALINNLNAGKFDVFDIGVLFLTTAHLIGPGPHQDEIASFNSELFSAYVTAEKLELARAHLDQEDINFIPINLSWEGRREAVKYALKSGRTDFHRERFGG